MLTSTLGDCKYKLLRHRFDKLLKSLVSQSRSDKARRIVRNTRHGER